MFDNSQYAPYLSKIYTAYNDWVVAFSNYLNQSKEIRATYNQVAQEKALSNQRSQFMDVRNSAIERIRQAGADLETAIEQNWRPNPQSFISKVVEVYSSEFLNPSIDDLEHAAIDYGKNGTMLSALYGIAKKRGIAKDIQKGSPLYHADRQEKLQAAKDLVTEVISIMNTTDPIKFAARQNFAENFEKYEAGKLDIIGNI